MQTSSRTALLSINADHRAIIGRCRAVHCSNCPATEVGISSIVLVAQGGLGGVRLDIPQATLPTTGRLCRWHGKGWDRGEDDGVAERGGQETQEECGGTPSRHSASFALCTRLMRAGVLLSGSVVMANRSAHALVPESHCSRQCSGGQGGELRRMAVRR